MKNATAFVCILEYAPFEPERYAELYTPLRRVGLEGITSPALRVQSAAAELAYLAAARAAYDGGIFAAKSHDDAEPRIGAPEGICLDLPEENRLDASGKTRTDEIKSRFAYSYAENGRPIVFGAHMSLSHTGGAAMAALSLLPVGADIERERRVSARIAKRIMSESEYAEFRQLDEAEKTARILECWTAKESFLKLTGEGILAGLDKLSFDRANSLIVREEAGETAHIVRLDQLCTVPNAEASAKADAQAEAENQRLFACICLEAGAEPELELLRFASPEAAAEFIMR